MIYSYVRYLMEPTPTIPSGEVYRPRVPIRISGPKRSVQIFGLLDTGADHVFVSESLAEVLGVEISGESGSASDAGGHEIDVWPGSVEIEISQTSQTLRWRADVGFLAGDDDPPIAFLGHVGFLEYFKAIFDYGERTVELIPKGDFSVEP
jgi:hypothetical protein